MIDRLLQPLANLLVRVSAVLDRADERLCAPANNPDVEADL